MKEKWAWAAAAIAVGSLGTLQANPAVGDSAGLPDTGAFIMVDEKDDGSVVQVRVGQPVELSLPENGAAGYRWEVERMDRDAVELIAHDAAYPTQAVGSSGRARFRFRARKPGAIEVVLKHWRPWEGDTPSTRRFHLLLHAAP